MKKEIKFIKPLLSIFTIIMLMLTIGQSIIMMVCIRFDVLTNESFMDSTAIYSVKASEFWNITNKLINENTKTESYDNELNMWVIVDESEEIITQNRNFIIGEIQNNYTPDKSNMQLSIKDLKSDEIIVNTFGKGEYTQRNTYKDNNYFIEYAIQSPLTADDSFKNAENSFNELKKHSNNLENSVIIYSILTIIGFVLLAKIIKPKDSRNFKLYEKIPADLLFLIMIPAIIIFFTILYDNLNSNLQIWNYLSYEIGTIINSINFVRISALVPAILAVKIFEYIIMHAKSKTLFKNILVYKITVNTVKNIQKIPIVWKTLIFGLIICSVNGLLGMFSMTHAFMWILFASYNILMIVGLCMFAYQMKLLQISAENLVKGNFQEQISTENMLFEVKKYGQTLNQIREGISIAVDEKLRLERMKTELITNVSHDIKTPLTSIVTCVELLQKEHTQAQHKEHLELLSRQSMRMKKLVEDLVEASKASTGNLTVNLQEIDLVETIVQALAEYEARFTTKELTILSNLEDVCLVLADGKYLWRVLDNLFSNIYKYAQIGSRVYISVEKDNEKAEITIKNISQMPLNISAEELLERFVRGDVSRTTDGSGLGLNISKSLMQAQKANLKLTVDGDLVKVVLIFRV